MKLIKKSNLFTRLIAILLTLMLVQTGFEIRAFEGDYNQELTFLIGKYKNSEYDEVIEKLEKLLNETGEEQGQIRGKFFFLLGASYEKKGLKEKAAENYLLGDLLLDKPELEGVDLKSLKVFKSTIFGKVINGKRVFEKVGKRKKKKKFPFFALLGAAALVATVFFLMKKKSGDEPVNFKEQYAIDVFNSIEWIDIPAGEFIMGNASGGGDIDEFPAHAVYMNAYKISKYEITYDQFKKFASVNPDIRLYHEGRGDHYPVTNVDQDNADRFCLWISEYTKITVKLPTEAQWEKAARGTDQRIYPWGNNSPDCSISNFNNCRNGTSEIGAFPDDRSFYGVMDMGGNVSEMVLDIYAADYYSVSPYSNPTGPNYGDLTLKVLRGANWNSSDPRATNRESQIWYRKNSTTGFRIVWIQ